MDQAILENDFVRLEALTLDNYQELRLIALEKDLLQYSPSDIATETALFNYVATAIKEKQEGHSIPYIIYDKTLEHYIGSTRYGLINPYHKVLHIGWTWISREAQGSGINKQMKFLMLRHAFEHMLFEKVAFRIDERNMRSRKAVEKIGGTLEGILRKNTLMQDGFRRSTCCYGILKEDWPRIKTTLFKAFN